MKWDVDDENGGKTNVNEKVSGLQRLNLKNGLENMF